MYLLMGCSFSV